MIKLNVQLFGGRGASSGAGGKAINGRPVIKSAKGYKYWNIGKNAPKGYIGLIQGQGSNAKTAYIKSRYADEVANFRSAGTNAMNYDSIKTLDTQIKRKEKQLDRYTETSSKAAIDRVNNELREMKRAREIRRKLGL